jgi:hypothetical protein
MRASASPTTRTILVGLASRQTGPPPKRRRARIGRRTLLVCLAGDDFEIAIRIRAGTYRGFRRPTSGSFRRVTADGTRRHFLILTCAKRSDEHHGASKLLAELACVSEPHRSIQCRYLQPLPLAAAFWNSSDQASLTALALRPVLSNKCAYACPSSCAIPALVPPPQPCVPKVLSMLA